MLDSVLCHVAEPLTAPLAARLAARRVRPGSLTLAGFACAIGAMIDIRYGNRGFALAFLVAWRVFDGLDGPLARNIGATAKGAYLDLVFDLVASAGIPFAFALAVPDRALAAMFAMLGLVARAATMTAEIRTTGALARAPVLVGRSELFVAYALFCLFPGWFSIVSYAVGVACFVGAGMRIAAVMVEEA